MEWSGTRIWSWDMCHVWRFESVEKDCNGWIHESWKWNQSTRWLASFWVTRTWTPWVVTSTNAWWTTLPVGSWWMDLISGSWKDRIYSGINRICWKSVCPCTRSGCTLPWSGSYSSSSRLKGITMIISPWAWSLPRKTRNTGRGTCQRIKSRSCSGR